MLQSWIAEDFSIRAVLGNKANDFLNITYYSVTAKAIYRQPFDFAGLLSGLALVDFHELEIVLLFAIEQACCDENYG